MKNDFSQYYSTLYSEKQLKADANRLNRLSFCFDKKIANQTILSIGCGPCVDIQFLINDNEVHGIDISNKALCLAQKKGVTTHNLDLTKVEKLPFDDDSFDVIIATDILEHIFFPDQLLLEIRRLMKPSGYAIISVPNHFYYSMRFRILFGKGIVLPFHNCNEWEYFHIRFFTSKSFELLLNNVNFEIANRYYDQFINIPRGLPHFIDEQLVRKFPVLFSMHFICKVKK